MKGKRVLVYVLTVIMLLSMTVGSALAEDGDLFRKNISKTPEGETEKAAIFMMDFYVPAQGADGIVEPVDNYLLADEVTTGYEAREFAKPLISVYIDDIGHTLDTKGGITFGMFDAFVGVSLDDGTSWKTTNLSRSADLSSYVLQSTGEDYPGDVHNVVHQVAGDNIFVAWASKYCEGGTPLYSLDPADSLDVPYFEDLEATYKKDAVYLYDLFGVAGNQGSVDYTYQGFPEIGEIPYSCIWTDRGKLIAGDDPSTDATEATYVIWAKPERLTSGKRDANLPAVDCAKDAGCILTWQEDPEGLRPGQGLGPGEGWSGAIANQKTDIWYSYISFADFDLVFSAEDVIGAIPMAEYALNTDATMPKSYVPMAMPTRLTDNDMCKAVSSQTDPTKAEDPYCYIDFDNIDAIDPLALPTTFSADSDYCADQVSWTNPGGSTLNLCKTEDGRVLNGQVASTRVRLNLKPYTTNIDADEDGVLDKSAWVIMAYEETKALGDMVDEETLDPIDIGKDIWYHSFDMFNHDMVAQGGMLDQPAVCKDETEDFCSGGVGQFYDIQVDEFENEFYLTEIARRFALTTNSVSAAVNSDSGLSAMLIFKQGIINQGGPADIMLRRVVIPDEFDPSVDNPYAYENMDCAEWAYTDGLNPNYLKGVCLSPAINISGTTIERCDGGTDNDTCAAAFPVLDDGSNPDGGDFPKVYEWRQCDGTSAIEGCEDDNDLDDQSWDNPYDVAKGHRGFLDGDIVMMMYAWAPNWNSNTVGNDHYNLYVRRSFDGGLTWTTTPAELGGEGVTVTEYYYGETIGDPVPVEWTYGAGEFEQGRNVSLLTGNKITILDPRYTPSGGLKLYPTIRTDWLTANGFSTDGLPYDDDLERDPSKYFIVYETGDNTTVEFGEATPLDLYYSRGTVYGDVYETMDYTTDKDDELLDRWPWLENAAEDLSGEAGVVANPGGTFMYAVWNQWREAITIDEEGYEHELIYDSDAWFRRLLYLPDDSDVATVPIASFLNTGKTIYETEPLDGTDGDIITMSITARDLDNLGEGDEIVEYVWTFETSDGYSQVVEECTGKICNVPARTLSEGWDGFGQTGGVGWADMKVKVKDNDPNMLQPDIMGNWSNEIKTSILIAKTIFKVNVPFITR